MKTTQRIVFNTNVFNDVWYKSEFISIQGSLIIVEIGFDSDGCTCAKDQNKNHDGCVIHDALLYCLREANLLKRGINLSRWQADKVLKEVLKVNKFKLFGWIPFSPEIYYAGVSLMSIKKAIFK